MYVEHNKPNWGKLQAISVFTSDSPKLGPALKNPYTTIPNFFAWVLLSVIEGGYNDGRVERNEKVFQVTVWGQPNKPPPSPHHTHTLKNKQPHSPHHSHKVQDSVEWSSTSSILTDPATHPSQFSKLCGGLGEVHW